MNALDGLGFGSEQHPGATVIDHCLQFGGCGLRSDRHGDVAGAQGSEIGHDELDAVGSTDRDAMPRYQSVRRHTGSDSIDPSIEISPGRRTAYRRWLNQRHGVGLRFGLAGNKISKVSVDRLSVDQPNLHVRVVHPPESGTRNRGPDIMVMT